MKTTSTNDMKMTISWREKEGTVLLTTMVLLFFLFVMVAGVMRSTLYEHAGGVYYQREREAFYNAEGGLRYIMGQISSDLASGDLGGLTGDVINVNYTAPEGIEFDPVTQLRRNQDGEGYYFVVSGHCENASASLEATIRRRRMLTEAGVFADGEIRLQPNQEFYSYDSDQVLNPVPADSTGEANLGSNTDIWLQNNNIIDGTLMLGESEDGVLPPVIAGWEDMTEYVGRINPDPLGAVDGPLAQAFIYYATHNDNAAAGIVGNEIDLGSHDELTLESGSYYLTDFGMGAQSTLTINGTPQNPVVIYLHGPLRVQPNSDLNVTSGQPSNFFIFCDTTDEMRFQPHGDARLFLYAPFAPIRFQPQGNIMGVLYGSDIRFQPGNNVYVDTSLLDKFWSPSVEMLQWRWLF